MRRAKKRKKASARLKRRFCVAPKRKLAKQDPANAGWQRDLSVSYEKFGDVLSAQGDLVIPLQFLQDGTID